jgi:hypothetical protein
MRTNRNSEPLSSRIAMLTNAPEEIAAVSHLLQIWAASVLSRVDFTRIQSLSLSLSALKRHAPPEGPHGFPF